MKIIRNKLTLFPIAKASLLPILFVINFTSCTTTPSEVKQIQASTILPQNDENYQIPKHLVIDPGLIEVYRVTRPIAELRHGPGVQYPLKDKVIAKNEIVIILESYKRWFKIYAPNVNLKGWIHKKTTAMFPYEKPLDIPFTNLPSGFVSSRKTDLLDFDSMKKTGHLAQKGELFKVLKRKKRFVLVYLPQTNSIAWIARRDIK